MKTIGFIGVGKMATAIISGIDKTKFNILISGRDLTKTEEQARSLKVSSVANHTELVKNSDLVILSVKPQILPSVMTGLVSTLTRDKTLISIAAGLTLADLKHLSQSENQPIIRVMPNINAQIGKSTSAIVKNEFVNDEDYIVAQSIFESVGTVHEVAEKDFSTFTALAGSSPAYIYMFIDALSRAGVLHGIPKETATKIVAETVQASAEMILQSGENPWSLVDKVSSPAGTTVAGVVSLEQNRFVGNVIDAITATIEREKQLN
ncbi:pyrroline-5-carboxylate reductase [Lactococcus protaetiae]|uniref:Pyrroline-5-carboxylate reductase n=1 Tax=Lactococcus protaetiae TaxID=2592653 RepID=A0A514ZBA7_9LACT|nr:pyrroline-5-carboxylate reductase [Lactococcus protaetiae]MCL2113931.1 pyrroline-5-carboxylate reductase [Streptococcaceae bacterium]QDK71861.1 pyrroline-5-carboxylate reductase [Lactococcus protaetiae]